MNTNDKFLEIYEKYKNLVLKLAFDMTKDYYFSQDICQETFMKLYDYQEHMDEYRVKNWLIVVAANLVRDSFRKGGKYKVILKDSREFFCSSDAISVDGYLEELEREDLRRRMLKGLRKKNPDWYEVFVLAEYLDVPRKVIAKQRGIALSTVDSYLRKSKSWMKSHYLEEYREL